MTHEIDAWGRVVVSADDLLDLLYTGIDPADLQVRDDPRVHQYNHWCATFNQYGAMIPPRADLDITPEAEHARRAGHWFVDPAFSAIDVRALLLDRCGDDAARARVTLEMDLFAARGLLGLLALMLALVDHFRREGIVWGVGRGSSCASYVLFLIGVHKVDSLRYDLDITEFLKP